MTDFTTAQERFSEGAHEEATDCFLRSAIDELIDCEYEPMMRGGDPIGKLLFAIAAASLSNDTARTSVIHAILDKLVDHSVAECESIEPARAASALEWRGDAALMTGRSTARSDYERAGELYAMADARMVDTWSMELGADRARAALSQYLDEIEIDADRRRLTHSDPAERLEYKTKIATEL